LAHPKVTSTLTGKTAYPVGTLREFYHLRWEVEEIYELVKELLEAENFRRKSRQFIDQEVMAMYLYCLLVRIMMMEAAVKHVFRSAGYASKQHFWQ
jgi:IS4 transposase